MLKALIAVVIGAVVLIVVLGKVESNQAAYQGDPTSDTGGTGTDGGGTSSKNKLQLTITGEVNKKGTYYIEEGGTLGDLIEAANGLTSNADDRCFEYSYSLRNNLTFYIAPLYDDSDTCSQTEFVKYNLNEASQSELENITGIKSALSTAIVSYRDNGGYFNRLEDIMEVENIGKSTFEKVKNYITIK